MNKIIANSVIASLLCATPALGNYVPSINVDAQGVANRNDYKLGIVSTSVVMPFFANNNSVLFGDLRFSRNNYNIKGVHIGLGMRKTINHFTVGLNGFYDNYVSDEKYGQYIAGIEAFNDFFKFRGTFYSPFNTIDEFRGVELAGTVRLGWISLGAKPYYFFHKTKDSIKGVEAIAKFEMPVSIFNLYASAGYQFDTKYRHQATVNFGANIALGQNDDGQSNTILPIERNMFIYGSSNNEALYIDLKKNQKILTQLENTLKQAERKLAAMSQAGKATQKKVIDAQKLLIDAQKKLIAEEKKGIKADKNMIVQYKNMVTACNELFEESKLGEKADKRKIDKIKAKIKNIKQEITKLGEKTKGEEDGGRPTSLKDALAGLAGKIKKRAADEKDQTQKAELVVLDGKIQSIRENFNNFMKSAAPDVQKQFVETQLRRLITSAKEDKSIGDAATAINNKMINLMSLNTITSKLNKLKKAVSDAKNAVQAYEAITAVSAEVQSKFGAITNDISNLKTVASANKKTMSTADQAKIDALTTAIDNAKTGINTKFNPLKTDATGADDQAKHAARTTQVTNLTTELNNQLTQLNTQSTAISDMLKGQIDSDNTPSAAPQFTSNQLNDIQNVVGSNSAKLSSIGVENTLKNIYDLDGILSGKR